MRISFFRHITCVLALAASTCSSLQSADVAQATNLQAHHRSGQTFLTWAEIQPPMTEATLSFPRLKEIQATLGTPAKVTYRLYRSDKPISALDGLTPIGMTGQLSCWDTAFNGYGDPKDTDFVERFIIESGKPALTAGTGLYVHNPRSAKTVQEAATGKPVAAGGAKLKSYYAVTAVIDGMETRTLSDANRLKNAVDEQEGQGVPVLQRIVTPKEFTFVAEPTLHYYVRWEAPPNANRENMPIDILIAIPKGMTEPVPVGLHLHCWGGNINSGYGWWYNAEKGALLVATNQNPYDWWTGYHELLNQVSQSQEAWSKGVVRPYSHRRLLSLLDWVKTQWKTDDARTFVGGNSMGGSGACMLAIRHPERFAWAIGWVGVHIPEKTPTFADSYALMYGQKAWNVKFEDGTPVWDYFSDVWYLRQHPEQETPFITFSNGKNDSAIGWPQAQEFYKAMQDTKRPHLFNWGQQGHSQRAIMPATLDQRVNPLDLRIDQSLPAFTHCSLDNNPGNGDPADGEAEGGINLYLTWNTTTIVDDAGKWEMDISLTDKAPKDTCTVDLTPRRLQKFKVKAGDKVTWTNTSNGAKLQSGSATADQHGLITLPALTVTKPGNRIQISK